MIQELLGGGLVEDSKISVSSVLLGAATNGPSSCSSTSSATSPAAVSPTTSTATNSEQQNLRCPRCDSTNTKFCYYNNYNLTQPRHFCKTCRRYWTKGGALRNVPIGGGCRKAKTTAISVGVIGKSGGNMSGSKAKILASDFLIGKSGLGGLGLGGLSDATGFDQELPSNPILWASPQNSHLLTLLRTTHRAGSNNANCSSLTTISNRNPSPSCIDPNPIRIKEEGPILGSHLVPEASLLRNALNARNMALDPFAQVPLGLSSSLWSSQYQYQQQQQQQQAQQHGSGLLLTEAPSSAIQELYQRLRPPGSAYADHQAAFLSNLGSSPSSPSCSVSLSNATAAATTAAAAAATATSPIATAANILEPGAVTGGEFGYWNSPFAWADMPTSNGAFP
ncbi:hypothetical protein Taro_031919 [Colocasia esculenta]|uniref:Dof zinc finger protein n=1 Tax=Colocasia esculenta TaxID=4460 RepID=A0A843VR98_COLES|nr:hypothetical protein [Colocasia esculenta]